MRSIIKNTGLGVCLTAALSVAALPEAMADDSAVQTTQVAELQARAVAGIKAEALADLRHNAQNVLYAYSPVPEPQAPLVAAPAPTYTADFASPDLLSKLIQATPAESLYRILPALTILSATEAE